MTTLGVLVHVRHHLTMNWEEVVWGIPAEDRLGDLTKMVEVLLLQGVRRKALIVMGSIGMVKNGVPDGEYTKTYLLKHFDKLQSFPRLKLLMSRLSQEELDILHKTFKDIVIIPELKNTAHEIHVAAGIFKQHKISQVIQVTSASHGPRCVQLQAVARAEGVIPRDQQWLMAISDICFKDSTPMSTFVIEAPHRVDDPMISFNPRLSAALLPYFYELSVEDKKKLNILIQTFMDKHRKR